MAQFHCPKCGDLIGHGDLQDLFQNLRFAEEHKPNCRGSWNTPEVDERIARIDHLRTEIKQIKSNLMQNTTEYPQLLEFQRELAKEIRKVKK